MFWIKTIPDRLHAFLPMRCGGTSVDCQATLRAAGTSSPDSSSNAGASRKNSGGRRTIAMMHKSNQLIMRVVSLFVNNWVVACAGQRDSALKGNSALRPYGARWRGSFCYSFLLGDEGIPRPYQSALSHTTCHPRSLTFLMYFIFRFQSTMVATGLETFSLDAVTLSMMVPPQFGGWHPKLFLAGGVREVAGAAATADERRLTQREIENLRVIVGFCVAVVVAVVDGIIHLRALFEFVHRVNVFVCGG